MLRLLLTRRWLGMSALLVLFLVAFTLLGRWQLGRAGRDGLSAVKDPAPVALSSLQRPGDPPAEATAGRRVTVAGRYVSGEQLLVPDQREVGRLGYWVLTPLRSEQGEVVPVVRGFVGSPQEAASAAPASGPVVVSGRLQPPQPFGTLTRELPAGQVPSVSPVDLAGKVSGDVLAGYVVRRSQQPDDSLRPVTPAVLPHHGRSLRLQNVAYALQWWFFAGFSVFWFLRMLRDEAQPSPQPAPLEPTGTVRS